MAKIIVVGPSLEHYISGYTWLKHNIVAALKEEGHDVFSFGIGDSRSNETLKEIKSRENYNEEITVEEISYEYKKSFQGFEDFYNLIEPDVLITVGDVEKTWFTAVTPEGEKRKCKNIIYVISEAKTMNRYFPVENREDGERLDIKAALEMYDAVIPATELTSVALIKDITLRESILTEPIRPPIHCWDIKPEKGKEYRKSIAIDQDCRVWFTIASNTVRKRIDQVLMYFAFHLLNKACDRLVLHTEPTGGADIEAIAARLGILRNVRVNRSLSKQAIEGVFSAGDTYISLPAAEGYGLPVFESLFLKKKVIHSSVGYPGHILNKIEGINVSLVEANIPYFPKVGNQVWYAITDKPKLLHDGIVKKGVPLQDVIETPETFRKKIIEKVEQVI